MTASKSIVLPSDFKAHPEWPGYGGDPRGNVYSTLGLKPRILNPWDKDSGHLCVSLRRRGRTHKVLVHRFILELFVGPCPEGMEACHGLLGPSVNDIGNLRWGTRPSNNFDRIIHGSGCNFQKIGPEEVIEIRKLKEHGWSNRRIAKVYRMTPTNIGMIVTRKTWRFVP